jgi:hypothetical protein
MNEQAQVGCPAVGAQFQGLGRAEIALPPKLRRLAPEQRGGLAESALRQCLLRPAAQPVCRLFCCYCHRMC